MMSSGFVGLLLFGSFAAVSAVLSSQPGPCASNPCQNDGYCHQFYYSDGYFCECTRDYTGFNCEQVHPCARGNPCLNYGSCALSQDQSDESFICHCPTGWAGKRCEKKVSHKPCPIDLEPCQYQRPNITDYASCKAALETTPPEMAACLESDREAYSKTLQSRSCSCRPSGVYSILQGEKNPDPVLDCFHDYRDVTEENPGTCSARGQLCGKLIFKVMIDIDLYQRLDCDGSTKAELADAVRCGEEWSSGQLDLTGCSMYEDVYNKFGNLLSDLAGTYCTDCPKLGPSLCMESYSGPGAGCRWLAGIEKRQQCFWEELQDDPRCAKFIPNLIKVTNGGWKLQNARTGRYCRKAAEYEKIFTEDWGCAVEGKGKGGPDSWDYGKGKGGPDSWDYGKDKGGPDSWDYGKGKGKGGPDSLDYGKGKGGPDSWDYGKGKGGPDSWDYGKGKGGPDSWDYGKGKGGPDSWDYGKGKGKGWPDSRKRRSVSRRSADVSGFLYLL